jgi:hypothetical protein
MDALADRGDGDSGSRCRLRLFAMSSIGAAEAVPVCAAVGASVATMPALDAICKVGQVPCASVTSRGERIGGHGRETKLLPASATIQIKVVARLHNQTMVVQEESRDRCVDTPSGHGSRHSKGAVADVAGDRGESSLPVFDFFSPPGTSPAQCVGVADPGSEYSCNLASEPGCGSLKVGKSLFLTPEDAEQSARVS